MASIKPTYSNKFTKKDRLSRKKWIEDLFTKGKSLKSNPLKVLYLTNESLENPQVLITVSKRNLKKASARNLLKRRIREAYRTQKHILNFEGGRNLMIAYIYLDRNITSYDAIEKAVIVTLSKIQEAIKDESVEKE